jgi:uncharacterized membrane protein YgdD (TMEM256/DUF423 family)
MNKKISPYIGYGALLMAISIVFGAFGAHSLKNILTPYFLDIYSTAVQYQIYHSLGIIILGIVSMFIDNRFLRLSKIFMILGIVFFCGSLYVLAFSGIKYFGIITPIGGVFFILSWIMLFVSINSKES